MTRLNVRMSINSASARKLIDRKHVFRHSTFVRIFPSAPLLFSCPLWFLSRSSEYIVTNFLSFSKLTLEAGGKYCQTFCALYAILAGPYRVGVRLRDRLSTKILDWDPQRGSSRSDDPLS